jgi:hypothetical protein
MSIIAYILTDGPEIPVDDRIDGWQFNLKRPLTNVEYETFTKLIGLKPHWHSGYFSEDDAWIDCTAEHNEAVEAWLNTLN